MKLITQNNCNQILCSGSIIDLLLSNNYSNISSITIDTKINNCDQITKTLVFTNNSITLPTGATQTTICDKAVVTNNPITVTPINATLTGLSEINYNFSHYRFTLTIPNYTGTVLSSNWTTNTQFNYTTQTGVLLINQSLNSVEFLVSSNITSVFTITNNIVDNGGLLRQYNYSINSSTLSSITTSTVTPTISSTGLVDNCTKYLVLDSRMFGLDLTMFDSGIYSINISINYSDGSCIKDYNSIFVDCVLKCSVVDCIYNTNDNKLMVLYDSLKHLDECDASYTPYKVDLYNILISSLCTEATTNTTDCGCN